MNPRDRIPLRLAASFLPLLAVTACSGGNLGTRLPTGVPLAPDDASRATADSPALTDIQATPTQQHDQSQPPASRLPADLHLTTEAIPPGQYLVYFDWKAHSLKLLAPDAAQPDFEVADQLAALAPDANTLAYLDDPRTLVVADLSSQEGKQVALPLECFDLPSWSPSADRLAVECEDRIYIYSTADESFRNLTAWGIQYVDSFHSPHWSPDGRQVAFFSRQLSSLSVSSQDGIYVTEVGCLEDSATCRERTGGPFLAYSNPAVLSWAPDSKRLAAYDSRSNLVVIDTDTGDESTVRGDLQYLDGMAWSPDGQWLAYSVEGDIFVISPEGGSPSLLSEGTGHVVSWINVASE